MRPVGRGITPAWAGKSAVTVWTTTSHRDHPRVGGEKSRVAPRSDPGTGSPPRGRGKVWSPQVYHRQGGITPAWAGKSLSRYLAAAAGRDHPRVGGEKTAPRHRLHFAMGSPPRGRGKEHAAPAGHAAAGITPAWAGKRLHLFFCFGQAEDHPRVGGEKFYVDEVLPGDTGSPPRGRGKGCLLSRSLHDLRITPAWAGKSCFHLLLIVSW